MRCVLVAILAMAGGVASAEPIQLKLTHEPAPHHLGMRVRVRAAAAASAKLPAPVLAKPEPAPPPLANQEPAQIRDLHERVSARVNLGYVVDGTQLTSGNTDPRIHSTIRAYGFGEGYLSTHGVAFDSLSSYFAGKFQLVHQNLVYSPDAINADRHDGYIEQPTPLATWFDRSGFEPRAAWAEVKDFLNSKTLAPLRIRAGQQYVYGPWVLHFYGAVIGWDGKLVRATAYLGSHVPDYTLSSAVKEARPGVGGGSLRFDLRDLSYPIPITLAAEFVRLSSGTNTDVSQHNQFEVDWRPRRDFALIAQARQLADKFVNQHVQARARYKEVTNFVFDLTHRASTDWRWDPTVLDPDPIAARRYLDLGPVLPQLVASARAGTLIAENIDVYLRGAIAADLARDLRDTYSGSYIEGGGALEVRLRRTLAIGASTLTRQTERDDQPMSEIADTPGQPDAIPVNASAQMGERGFTEIGTTARLSLGARKFSLLLEVYGRRTRYSQTYCAIVPPAVSGCQSALDTGIQQIGYRGGGRAQIDAWIGNNLRLFASYDLSSSLEFTPSITGYKSLRLMMEGIY